MARMEMDYNMDKLENTRLWMEELFSTNERNTLESEDD